MDCGPPGSSVRGILQARILEWIAFPSPEDLPDPGTEPGLLHCRRILYHLSYRDYPAEVTNRFKGLDLVDRVPEELCVEDYNIVQEAMTKIIPKKEKCKKVRWLSEEALQIDEERREAKGKGERERYIQVNAEFQRIGRRDKRPSSMNNAKK